MILTWDAPAEDAESVTGYRIKRRAPDKGQRNLKVLVEDTGSAETTYIDTTTKNGVRYVYRVHALRGEVVSAESNFALEIQNPCHSYPYAHCDRDQYAHAYSNGDSHLHA